jgi:dipeptidyl aminopeptidase/acylaminoacyl peptidase
MTIVTNLKAGALILAAVAAAVAAAVVVTLIVGTKPAGAAFPGANGKIAFASNRVTAGNPIPPGQTRADAEIFTMNPNGTGIQQATFNTAHDQEPAFSPDGTKIVFASNLDGDFEIYMADPNGAQQKPLTTNSIRDAAPAFSPGGDKIVFGRDDEIYSMDAVDINPTDGNGDDQTRLTNNSVGDSDPTYSPDGQRLAFQSNPFDIYAMKPVDNNGDGNGDGLTQLTSGAGEDNWPNYSPDGSKITFTRFSGSNLLYQVFVMKQGRHGPEEPHQELAGRLQPRLLS